MEMLNFFFAFPNNPKNMTEKSGLCFSEGDFSFQYFLSYIESQFIVWIMSSSQVIWCEAVGVRQFIDVTQDLKLSSSQWMKKIQQIKKYIFNSKQIENFIHSPELKSLHPAGTRLWTDVSV